MSRTRGYPSPGCATLIATERSAGCLSLSAEARRRTPERFRDRGAPELAQLEAQLRVDAATDLELPATTLARLTGHADAGFTLKVYAKDARDEQAVVSDVLKRAASARIGAQARVVIVYAIIDDSLSSTSPLGDALDVFIRRADAERFIEEVRGDDPELAEPLRIEECELDAGGLN